jgi:UDP-glucose 4-epimerase
MRIFVTGATGFIGSHVAYRLLGAGHELTILARDPDKTRALSSHPRVRRVTGKLTDFALIRDALGGCEACIHIALGWGDTPVDMLDADTRPTGFLVGACAELGVKKFIYTSSTAALGPFFADMNEQHRTMPNTLYGATKAASESYVLAVGATTAVQCSVIRPGYTFGNPVVEGAPMESDQRFRTIVESALGGKVIELEAGDGTQFIWAGDLARLYEAVLATDVSREIYYGLGKSFTSWEAIARRAIELTGSSSTISLRGTPRAPDLFDLSKIERTFGLAFESEPHLSAHLEYLAQNAAKEPR